MPTAGAVIASTTMAEADTMDGPDTRPSMAIMPTATMIAAMVDRMADRIMVDRVADRNTAGQRTVGRSVVDLRMAGRPMVDLRMVDQRIAGQHTVQYPMAVQHTAVAVAGTTDKLERKIRRD